MPNYIFKCEKCNHEDDMIIPFSEFDNDQVCPKCNEVSYKRQFSMNPHRNFDFAQAAGVYEREWGTRAWKRNMSVSDQADVLSGKKAPY